MITSSDGWAQSAKQETTCYAGSPIKGIFRNIAKIYWKKRGRMIEYKRKIKTLIKNWILTSFVFQKEAQDGRRTEITPISHKIPIRP